MLWCGGSLHLLGTPSGEWRPDDAGWCTSGGISVDYHCLSLRGCYRSALSSPVVGTRPPMPSPSLPKTMVPRPVYVLISPESALRKRGIDSRTPSEQEPLDACWRHWRRTSSRDSRLPSGRRIGNALMDRVSDQRAQWPAASPEMRDPARRASLVGDPHPKDSPLPHRR
jgi:hypothetical protein